MKTVLITGASGFVGKAVVKNLVSKRMYNVVAVTSGRKKIDFPDGVQEEKLNLLDERERAALLERVKPDVLIHLAWGQETSDFRGSATNLQWLEVSTSLLRHFAKNGGECFYFAGTSDEYSDDNGKAHEVDYTQRMTLYGECKKAFSNILTNYCSRNNLRYVDARFFTVYGAGDPHTFGAIPQTITDLLQDKPVVCKAPNTIRDYVYVGDVAEITAQLIASDYCGSVNVASGQPRMMRDVFKLIAKTLEKEGMLSFENENKCEQILVADTSVLHSVIGDYAFAPYEATMQEYIMSRKRCYE